VPKLSDVSNKALRELLGNRLYKKSALVATGAAATFAVTSAPAGGLVYSIDGVVGAAKADVTVEPLVTLAALQFPITGTNGFYTLPAGATCYFTIVLNAAGTYYAIQSTYAGQVFTPFRQQLGSGDVADIVVPSLYVPVGIIKVVNLTNPFIPATTLWNAAGVTTTTVDVAGVLPSVNP